MIDYDTGIFYRVRFPHGWQTAMHSGNAFLYAAAPDFPEELGIRITGQEDTGEKKQACEALLRGDRETFERIYGDWGYENFRYQTYSGSRGNLIEVRYETVAQESGSQTARLVDYFRTDIPFCVSLTTDHPAWDAETRAAWNWGGYGLDKVALWMLDSLETV